MQDISCNLEEGACNLGTLVLHMSKIWVFLSYHKESFADIVVLSQYMVLIHSISLYRRTHVSDFFSAAQNKC